MKVRITLSGEDNCSTVIDCTKDQYDFLIMISNKMGDEENNSYSPSINVEKLIKSTSNKQRATKWKK